jgi:hypothetical protein
VLGKILKEIKNEDQDKPIIALSHYGLDFLQNNEQKRIKDILVKYNVKLFLSGHSHDRDCEPQTYNEQTIYCFSCGTLKIESQTSITFLLGEMVTHERSGKVYSYQYEVSRGWADDSHFAKTGSLNYKPFYYYEKDSNPSEVMILHKSSGERADEYRKVNSNINRSISIYGSGLTSVSKNPRLFEDVIEKGGTVRLCMSNADFMKTVDLDNYDEYLSGEQDINGVDKSFTRILKICNEIKEKPTFQFKTIKEFFPLSINIVDEDTEDAKLIIENRLPYSEQIILHYITKNKNRKYFNEILNCFNNIWNASSVYSDELHSADEETNNENR